MPLKTVEIEGKKYGALDEEGKVIYVDSEGKEVGYDGEDLASRLTAANGESASRRHEIKDLNEKLKTFEGITDAAAAIKAMETVKNLDDKKLIDAGEVETIKTEAIKVTEDRYKTLIAEKYEPLEAQRDQLQGKLNEEIIGNKFANSAFIGEKMVVPVPMVKATFRQHFDIGEDGKVTAKYPSGEQVYSKSNPGSIAEFDEALELLVDRSPMREQILKGAAHKGGTGGPGPGGGGDDPNSKVITRAEFEKLSTQRKSDILIKEGFKVIDD